MKKNLRLKTDRRRYPRIVQALPLKVVADGYDLSTTTENISCIGAYCRLDRYIPPFTKIAVRLTLPIPDKKTGRYTEVECKGVVVRTEDNNKNGFNIAIYFNEIKENQRKKISRYINQFLPQDTSDLKRS
ncbi:MAG: PilZ domain-containing protein [Candidatus Omnitrophica bacterium]|nr:PilZ domain-containing protein [Candidatus Omnitrophota bacterium]